MNELTSMGVTLSALVSKYGKTLQYTRTVQGEYNPGTGDAPPLTTKYRTKTVVSTFRGFEIDGDLIRTTDVKLILSGQTEPQVGDIVEAQGRRLRVVSITDVAPAGSSLAHILVARV